MCVHIKVLLHEKLLVYLLIIKYNGIEYERGRRLDTIFGKVKEQNIDALSTLHQLYSFSFSQFLSIGMKFRDRVKWIKSLRSQFLFFFCC